MKLSDIVTIVVSSAVILAYFTLLYALPVAFLTASFGAIAGLVSVVPVVILWGKVLKPGRSLPQPELTLYARVAYGAAAVGFIAGLFI